MDDLGRKYNMFFVMCTMVGTSLFLSYIVLIFDSDRWNFLWPQSEMGVVANALFLLAAGIVMFCVSWNGVMRFTSLLKRGIRLTFLAVLLSAPLMAISFLETFFVDGSWNWLASFLGSAVFALAGAGAALAILPWFVLWVMHTNAQHGEDAPKWYRIVFFAIFFSVLISVLLGLTLSSLTAPFRSIAPVALLLLSLGMGLFCCRVVGLSEMATEAPFRHISDIGKEEASCNIAPPFAAGITAGLAASGYALCDCPENLVITVTLLIVVGVCNCVGLYNVLHGRKALTFYTSIKFIMFAQGIFAFLLPLVPDSLIKSVLAVILMEGLFYILVLFSSSCKACGGAGMSPLFFTSRTTYRIFIGAALGFLASFFLVSLFGSGLVSSLVCSICGICTVVCLFMFTKSLDDLDAFYAHEEHLRDVDDDESVRTPIADRDPSFYSSDDYGRWKRRCFALANEKHLTQREAEVFVMLAKGEKCSLYCLGARYCPQYG